MTLRFIGILSLLVFMACSANVEDGKDTSSTKDVPSPPATTTNVVTATATGTAIGEGKPTSIVFQGYVASAFEVTVDGTQYKDMEDFYTQELDKLPQKVKDAGYDATYEVRFDAQLGMSDLWVDMDVYIAPASKRGYQAQGRVGQGGAFTVQMPDDAAEDTYKVRANKRINIVLTKDKDVQKICFNFSAVDKSVLLSEKEKPIILDQFETSLTKYACAPDAGSDMQIPAPSNVGTDTASLTPAPATCLSDCSTPAAARYSFSSTVAFSPASCTVTTLDTFDTGAGLLAIYGATCGATPQLYAVTVSYDGTSASTPVLVSSICSSQDRGVLASSSSRGRNGALATFTCSGSSGKATTYAAPVSLNGIPGTTQTIEAVTLSADTKSLMTPYYLPENARGILAWNDTAGAFGLARTGRFQRLSDTGKPIGGAVTIAESTDWPYYTLGPIDKVLVRDGNWYILRGGNAISDSSLSCSKIDPLGVPQCDDKLINMTRMDLLGDGHTISAKSDGELRVSTFDPGVCSAGSPVTIGTVNGDTISHVYNSQAMTASTGALLFSTPDNALKVAVYTTSPAYALASEISVTNTTSVTTASVAVIKKRLFVTYVDRGTAFLAVNDQDIQ